MRAHIQSECDERHDAATQHGASQSGPWALGLALGGAGVHRGWEGRESLGLGEGRESLGLGPSLTPSCRPSRSSLPRPCWAPALPARETPKRSLPAEESPKGFEDQEGFEEAPGRARWPAKAPGRPREEAQGAPGRAQGGSQHAQELPHFDRGRLMPLGWAVRPDPSKLRFGLLYSGLISYAA